MVHHVPYLRNNPLKNYAMIKQIMKAGDYDIVHSHIEALNAYSLFLAYKCGIPKRISHSHGTDHYSGNWIKRKVYDLIKKRITEYATVKLSCSQKAGEWLYNGKNFELVPNCIDYKRFAFDKDVREAIRHKNGFSDEAYIIGTVGHLSDIKNHIFLEDVLFNLSKKSSNYYLAIVGEGENKKKIEQKAESLFLCDRIAIFPPTPKVEQYYQMFDLYALPSLHEGFPMTVLEAQVSGLPVLLSEGVPPDVMISGNTDRLPLNVEQWVEIIENRFNSRLDRENVSIDQSYDIVNCAKDLEEIYLS
jgi:glycosyltransferase involved in cell wall biosynthesis